MPVTRAGIRSALRFASNVDNIIQSLSADSVAPSDAILANPPDPAEGSGRVLLLPDPATGGYTGSDDTEIEVEITATAGSTSVPGAVVFVGVGNQALTGLTVDNTVVEQTITAELTDLGTDASTAALKLDTGRELAASVAGAAGNLLSATIDESALTESAAFASLTDAWPSGSESQVGEQYDFGAVPLEPDGTIPADAPFLRIGYHWTVYRHFWSIDDDGIKRYHLDPPPPVELQTGARVRTISGTWSIDVTDGVTTRTYPGLVTRYDWYTALQADGSRICEPPTVVVNDRRPGGQAARAVNLISRAFVRSVNATGSDAVQRNALAGLAVDAAQPTERLTLACIVADRLNAERWELYGPLYGRRQLVTGEAFSANGVTLQVPTISLPPSDEAVKFYISAWTTDARPHDLVRPALGVNAQNTTFRLRYEARPVDEECTPTPVSGGPKLPCLGRIDALPTEAVAMDADYKSNVQTLLTWHNTASGNNITVTADVDEITMDAEDLLLFEELVGVFQDALRRIVDGSTGALRTAALADWNSALTAMMSEVSALSAGHNYDRANQGGWAAAQTYVPGSVVRPSDPTTNTHHYLVVTGTKQNGTGTEPTWTTVGGTITHEGVTYKDMGEITIASDIDAETTRGEVTAYVEKWTRRLRTSLVAGEIDPFEFASLAGSECWRDRQTTHWWVFIDEDRADYMPVQPGYYYHATRRVWNPATGEYAIEPTFEWGFGLQWCEESPPEAGDEITITLSGVPDEEAYTVGDKYLIDCVAAQALDWRGGADGDNTHTYRISGSVAGVIGAYSAVDPTPAAFSGGGLGFTITRGDRTAALGDLFRFAVERRSWRWIQDGGTPSADMDITTADTDLGNGLLVRFEHGALESFVDDDIYSFSVEQPASPSHALNARGRRYQAKSDTPDWTLTGDAGAPAEATLVIIGPHDLPSTATITYKAGSTAAMSDYAEAITWREGFIVQYLAAAQTYQYHGISVTGAAGGRMQWLYAGPDQSLSVQVTELALSDVADMIGDLSAQAAAFGVGAAAQFDFLSETDMALLRTLWRYAKDQRDEPLALIPNAAFPAEAALVRMPDQLPRDEARHYQRAEAGDQRRHQTALTLPAYLPPPFV